MNKLFILIGTFLIVSGSMLSQEVDSTYYANVGKYLYHMPNSATCTSLDSNYCFSYNNDTIKISLTCQFHHDFDSIFNDSLVNSRKLLLCSDINEFMKNLGRSDMLIISDSIMFLTCDTSFFNTDSISPEQFVILDTLSSNIYTRFVCLDSNEEEFVVGLYFIKSPNRLITVFGKSKSSNSQILFPRLDAIITKYELNFAPY